MPPESTLDPVFADVLKIVISTLGGIVIAWISQKAAKRNDKAAAKTGELDNQLRPLESATESWQEIAADARTQLAEMRAEREAETAERHADRENMHALENSLHDLGLQMRTLHADFNRAIDQLIHFARWIDDGALPPPPDIPEWLRTHMVRPIRDVFSSDKHQDEDPQKPQGA